MSEPGMSGNLSILQSEVELKTIGQALSPFSHFTPSTLSFLNRCANAKQ